MQKITYTNSSSNLPPRNETIFLIYFRLYQKFFHELHNLYFAWLSLGRRQWCRNATCTESNNITRLYGRMFCFTVKTQESLADAKGKRDSSARMKAPSEEIDSKSTIICDFLLMVNSNRGRITYGLRDIFGCRGWKSPFSLTVLCS